MRSTIPFLTLTAFAFGQDQGLGPLAARAFPPGLEKGGWQVDIFRTVTGPGYNETVNAKYFDERFFPNGFASTCSKSRPNPNEPQKWTEACDPSDKSGNRFFYVYRSSGDFEILQGWNRPNEKIRGAAGLKQGVTLERAPGKDRLKASFVVPIDKYEYRRDPPTKG